MRICICMAALAAGARSLVAQPPAAIESGVSRSLRRLPLGGDGHVAAPHPRTWQDSINSMVARGAKGRPKNSP